MEKANLLLVEDSRIMAQTLKALLLKTGDYEVSLAINGVEALAKLKVQFFPIILTDLMMPEMDGFQLLQEAKNSKEMVSKENIDPIFLVISSLDQEQDIHRALSLGAYDVIPKPLAEDLFLAKMKNYYRLFQLMWEAEKRFQDIKKLNSEIMDSYENRLLESQCLTGAIEEQKEIYKTHVEIINQIQSLAEPIDGKEREEIMGQCKQFLELDNLGKGQQ